MKTKFYGIIAVIAAIGLLFAACSNPSGGDTGTQNPPPIVKSVSVGAQSGTMTAGAAGSVSYHVTTTNIADGSYTVSVNNLPADLSVSGKVTISGGEGLLTLAGSVSTTARTISNLSLTIDGTTSAVFSLTIAAPDTPSVSVGKQSGTLTAGVAGTVTFTITTANIAANTYTAAVANLPAGVTVSGSVVIASNTGTLTLAGDNLTAAGTTSKLTLTINGTTSAAFAITIIPHPDDGTQAYPFKVTTAADLQKVGTETTSGGWTLSAYYKQTTNIDLSGIANWTPIGSGLSFIGTYDGGGFTISNLKVSHTGGNTGLFGGVTNGTLKNINLTNVDVSDVSTTAVYNIGGLAGVASVSTITNCSSSGKVTGPNSSQRTGGIVGYANFSNITFCSSSCTVTSGGGIVGGLAGLLEETSTSDCYSTGTVTATGNYIGGLAGQLSDNIVERCYAGGAVKGTSYVGGLIGGIVVYATISPQVWDCYATGTVQGANSVGGIAGYSGAGSTSAIDACYATGNVTGDLNTGGIAGYISDCTVKNCAALNERIDTTSAAASAGIGRVVGNMVSGGTLSNNAAYCFLFSGGILIPESVYTAGIGLALQHGATITAPAIKADGSIGGRFTSPSWTTQNGSRPGFGAPWALPAYLLADGTTYPFMVNTVGDLQKVGTQTASGGWTLSAKYKQTADIDLSVITNLMWTPIGNGSQFFNGTYDGAGYTISSLNINNPTLNNQGLFGLLSGTVKNLALTGVDITGGDSTGGIAGESDGTIQNCYVTGSITGKLDTGGIAGYVNLGSVTNCYTTCNVVGSSSQAGGIAGYTRGTIQYCYSTGNITGYTYVGGIAGVVSSNSTSSQPGIVQYCVALNKNVTATGSTTVGRVAGNNSNGTLNNYARPTPQLTSKSTTGLMILTDINGPVYVFSPGNATGINGLDVAAANYNSAGSLKWWPDNGFTSTNWSSAANRLPWLKTDGGSVFRNQSPVVTQ